MGRLMYAIAILVFLQMAMTAFLGAEIPGTSIVDAIINLPDWESSTFVSYLSSIFTVLGGIAIIAGLYVVRNDFVVYAGIAAVLFSFASIYYEAYQQFAARGILGGSVGELSMLLVVLVPFIVSWFIILLEFMRGRD